jgi:hypothetical protein
VDAKPLDEAPHNAQVHGESQDANSEVIAHGSKQKIGEANAQPAFPPSPAMVPEEAMKNRSLDGQSGGEQIAQTGQLAQNGKQAELHEKIYGSDHVEAEEPDKGLAAC